jgi:hypothetical protein
MVLLLEVKRKVAEIIEIVIVNKVLPRQTSTLNRVDERLACQKSLPVFTSLLLHFIYLLLRGLNETLTFLCFK